MKNRRWICLLLIVQLLISLPLFQAQAYKPTTLRYGMRGEEVAEMQQALIDLKYLTGEADGYFGRKTENAVKMFQRANGLTVDGLAGTQTLTLLYKKQAEAAAAAGAGGSGIFSGNYTTIKQGMTGNRVRILQNALKTLKYYTGTVDGKFGKQTRKAVQGFQKDNQLTVDGKAGKKTLKAIEKAMEKASDSEEADDAGDNGSGIFSGNYKTIKQGMTGNRVRILQNALKTLKYYTGTVDGIFEKQTKKAVKEFQKDNQLTVDGKAGKKTLKAIEKAIEKVSDEEEDTENAEDGSDESVVSIPSLGSVKLLHWFNDIKPTLKNGQYLQLVDPATGLSWTLRLYSLGRHADAEPLTAKDTETMIKAFGGVNTWNQQAVYVKLPDGTWTIGSTHDMPHMSGSISDNNFNGHLCVHFLRDMSECQKNDPKYGVANQKTIREFWKSLTGITVE